MSKSETPKPMDDGIREEAVGVPGTNRQRVCYAIKQLVTEVHDLFPETPVEYSDYDGRNTALAVTFDLTPLDSEDRRALSILLGLLGNPARDDMRVGEAITDPDHMAATVSMRANPRTQDIRDSFGLADAWEVLIEDEEASL